MRASPTSIEKMIRLQVALALALWVSHVCCLASCAVDQTSALEGERSRSEMANISASAVTSSCPSRSTHSCCRSSKGGHDKTRGAWPSFPTTTISCCQPMDQLSDQDSKSRVVDRAPFAPAVSIPLSLGKEAGTLRLPDKGRTYQRCCVFLI